MVEGPIRKITQQARGLNPSQETGETSFGNINVRPNFGALPATDAGSINHQRGIHQPGTYSAPKLPFQSEPSDEHSINKRSRHVENPVSPTRTGASLADIPAAVVRNPFEAVTHRDFPPNRLPGFAPQNRDIRTYVAGGGEITAVTTSFSSHGPGEDQTSAGKVGQGKVEGKASQAGSEDDERKAGVTRRTKPTSQESATYRSQEPPYKSSQDPQPAAEGVAKKPGGEQVPLKGSRLLERYLTKGTGLTPGDRLPNRDTFARKFSISISTVNTVMRKYDRMGIIHSCGGQGTYYKEVPEGVKKPVRRAEQSNISEGSAARQPATGQSAQDVRAELRRLSYNPGDQIDPKVIAASLGISPRTVNRLLANNELVATRPGLGSFYLSVPADIGHTGNRPVKLERVVGNIEARISSGELAPESWILASTIANNEGVHISTAVRALSVLHERGLTYKNSKGRTFVRGRPEET